MASEAPQDIEKTTLDKLQRMLDQDEPVEFSKDEAAVLQKTAQVMLALRTFGTLGGIIKSVLVWVGLVVALGIAIKSGHILDFFTSQGGSP